MTLTSELLKTTSIKGSSMIADSKIFTEAELIRTNIPALNVAVSGKITGGYGSGITVFAAPSKSFKTMFSLILLKAFQKKNPNGTIIFYDSEFGSPPEYLKAAGLNLDNIIHIPLKNLEEVKFDMISKLETIKRSDKVLLFIDSIGNLASKKEIEDAKDEKSVADMTRAKQLKSLFRMVTPYLSILDIPLIAVNHTYQEIGMFPKTIMGGGTGALYSSNNIFFISKSQEKEGKEFVGSKFTIIAEKSRNIKEKSKIPVIVTFEKGVDVFSGIVEWAMEFGSIVKPKNGWYAIVNMETGEVQEPNLRFKEINSGEYLIPIMKNKDFQSFIEEKYLLAKDDFQLVEDIIDMDELD